VDDGSVVFAVRRDVADLGRRLAGVDASSEARALERLAVHLDGDLEAPLSARVSAAREIREGLEALRSRVPEAPAVDRLDELASRRSRRVAR
jgi:hypothetical protein